MKTSGAALILLAAAVGVSGCATKIHFPDLRGIYDQAAMQADYLRNPVIVIPGILGSKLVDGVTGVEVWGAFGGNFADPDDPAGLRLLALPMAAGRPLSALKDGVVPAGALDRLKIKLYGVPLEAAAYMQILAALGVGGFRDQQLAQAGAVDYGDQHFTCFQFAYDWRRDNSENAARLHEFILEKRAYVIAELQRRYNVDRSADLKFDLVAHSMGGLVTRYYLQYGPHPLPDDGSLPPLTWEGTQYVNSATLIGTPNGGSAGAIWQLVQGTQLAPVLPHYPPSLLGTFPAVYQLMPRPRHGCLVDATQSNKVIEDYYDPAVWVRFGWGLADPREQKTLARMLPDEPDDAARRAIALEHQRKCLEKARQFHAAMDAPAPLPPGFRLSLIAGDAIQTLETIAVNPANGRITGQQWSPGDGTVLRTSALLDERVGRDWQPRLQSPIEWSQVTFLFDDHIGLTRSAAFTDNMLYYLLENPN